MEGYAAKLQNLEGKLSIYNGRIVKPTCIGKDKFLVKMARLVAFNGTVTPATELVIPAKHFSVVLDLDAQLKKQIHSPTQKSGGNPGISRRKTSAVQDSLSELNIAATTLVTQIRKKTKVSFKLILWTFATILIWYGNKLPIRNALRREEVDMYLTNLILKETAKSVTTTSIRWQFFFL